MNDQTRRSFLKFAAAGTALGCSPIFLSASEILLPFNDKFLQACSQGNVGLVKKLLADDRQLLSAKDKLGRTGFALAKLASQPKVADFLKQSGYQTDLHESVLDLDWERYEQLAGEENEKTVNLVNSDHPIGGNVMWAAATGGAGSDTWRVYAKCSDPNGSPRGQNGTTPLQAALRFSDLKTAEITAATLLSNNTNPNPAPNQDASPLHIAAERGSTELVEMLVRLGADVDAKNADGLSAKQVAEENGHPLVHQMLENQDQIPRTCRTSRSAYDVDGQPYAAPDISDIPLYLRRNLVGQAHSNLEYVQKEVAAEPRMAHSVATTSEICVEACAHIGRKPIVEFLLKNGAPYSLPTAVMLNDMVTVKRLLDEDPNRIQERGAHDFGLLWYPAIGRCPLEMTQLLFDRGAKVEQQHFLGTTALHWACQRGPIELVELLVENGADVNRLGRKFKAEGETPLQSTRDEKIADYLRSKGAN